MLFGAPLIPLRVVHVSPAGIGKGHVAKVDAEVTLLFFDMGRAYSVGFLPLRYSFRYIAKAFLRAWGMWNVVVGPSVLIAGLLMLAMDWRVLFESSWTWVILGINLLLAGVVFLTVFWILNRRDMALKRILGVHDRGVSDPYYWPNERIEIAIKYLPHDLKGCSLLESVRKRLKESNPAAAMFIARLAQRREPSAEIDELFHEILIANA